MQTRTDTPTHTHIYTCHKCSRRTVSNIYLKCFPDSLLKLISDFIFITFMASLLPTARLPLGSCAQLHTANNRPTVYATLKGMRTLDIVALPSHVFMHTLTQTRTQIALLLLCINWHFSLATAGSKNFLLDNSKCCACKATARVRRVCVSVGWVFNFNKLQSHFAAISPLSVRLTVASDQIG